MQQLPETGFIRLGTILGLNGSPPIVPVSKSTWYRGIREGIYPPAVKLANQRASAWRAEDIRALLERLGKTQQARDSKK